MQQNPNPPNSGLSNALDEAKKSFQDGLKSVYDDIQSSFRFYEKVFDDNNAKLAEQMGQTQKIVSSLRQETAVAFTAVVGLEGELKNVQEIQLGITKELNTNVITMGETVTELYAGAKAEIGRAHV